MSDGGWITRASRTLFKTRWLHLREDEVRLPGGEDITYTWVDHGGYVVVVPILGDGRVVMERVYRHTVKRTLLECPSGGLDGEDPIVAGRRELEEETGYTAREWQHLAAFYGGVGTSNERFDIVVARDLREDGHVRREATEQIEVVCVPLVELRAQVLRGELEDGPSALAILLVTAGA
jgi:ADP-ribose pyrophosphatase